MNQNTKNKKNQFASACDVIQGILGNRKTPLGQQFGRWRLWSQWHEVVGPQLAKVCLPVDYKNGVLFLYVESSCQLQDLSFMKNELLAKINTYVGFRWVRDLRFTTHRRNVPDASEAPELWSALLKENEFPE